jgi:hypothetical protein
VISDEITSSLAKFFEGGDGPSHDELTRAFKRTGLLAGDPSAEASPVGKMKRVRGVLGYALDCAPAQGAALVKSLLALLRANGSFRRGSESYAGTGKVAALRHAFRTIGFDLDSDGQVRPILLENLEGVELTEALWAYVRRARTGADDIELVIGTSKNLEEAAARHVLKEKLGTYPTSGPNSHFPMLLGRAFAELNLTSSTSQLDRDPYVALQQAIFLMGLAVNRLRNASGDGHGRPEPATATALEGRLATQASAMVTELLLAALGTSEETPA